MAGPNTTGTPNTSDYSLGRGILYFAPLDSGGIARAWRDMGNSPDFKINNASESLEHQSSRTGLKQTDKEVTLSRTTSLTFQLDEFNDQNLSALFSGTQATHTNVAVAGFTVFVMVPDGQLASGRWFDIVNASGNRAYDIDKTKLTITTNEGTPVALVQDVDYSVDEEMGRIFTISTSTKIATSIAAGKGLKVILTADVGAKAVYEIKALQSDSITGALKFIADNPADDGKRREYQFHQVSLKADGDLSLIGDDWSVMSFTAKAEQNALADADSPTLTIRIVAD